MTIVVFNDNSECILELELPRCCTKDTGKILCTTACHKSFLVICRFSSVGFPPYVAHRGFIKPIYRKSLSQNSIKVVYFSIFTKKKERVEKEKVEEICG